MLRKVPGSGSSTWGKVLSLEAARHIQGIEKSEHGKWLEKKEKENHAESCRPGYRLPTSRVIEGTKELKYRERKRKASLSCFKASHT